MSFNRGKGYLFFLVNSFVLLQLIYNYSSSIFFLTKITSYVANELEYLIYSHLRFFARYSYNIYSYCSLSAQIRPVFSLPGSLISILWLSSIYSNSSNPLSGSSSTSEYILYSYRIFSVITSFYLLVLQGKIICLFSILAILSHFLRIQSLITIYIAF